MYRAGNQVQPNQIQDGKIYIVYPNINKPDLPESVRSQPPLLGKFANFTNYLGKSDKMWGSWKIYDTQKITSAIDTTPLTTIPYKKPMPGVRGKTTTTTGIIINRIPGTADPNDDYIFKEAVPYDPSLYVQQVARQKGLPSSTSQLITSFLVGDNPVTTRTPAPPVEKGGRLRRKKSRKSRKTRRRKSRRNRY